MTKPLVIKFLGGSLRIIGRNDEYKDPSGSIKQYEKSKIMLAVGGQKQSFEIPKDAYDCLRAALAEQEVQQKLQDWE